MFYLFQPGCDLHHHIHTEYDDDKNPITSTKGGDAAYPITKQAETAVEYGLDWIIQQILVDQTMLR